MIYTFQHHRHFSVVHPAFLHMLQALPSQATIVSPAALLRHVSSTRAIQQEGAGSVEEPWNQDLLQALLAAIYKVTILLTFPHNLLFLFALLGEHAFDSSSQSIVSLCCIR